MPNSFLATFKPEGENPKGGGWSLSEYRGFVNLLNQGDIVEKDWTFANRSIKEGDRVFFVQQGKNGPIVRGYGRAVGGKIKMEIGALYSLHGA